LRIFERSRGGFQRINVQATAIRLHSHKPVLHNDAANRVTSIPKAKSLRKAVHIDF